MENQIRLVDLPEEIIEKITTYLDLRDLKFLTQTCKLLEEISWRSLSEITEIHFYKILSFDDIKTFTTSKRKYQNVRLSTYNSVDDVTLVEQILNQVSSIPSIKLYNITLKLASREVSEEMHRVLQLYDNDFKTIIVEIDLKDSDYQVKADKIRSLFPKAKIIFQPFFSPSSNINFDEVNEGLCKPKEVLFRNNFQKIEFNTNVDSVKNLTMCCDLVNGLEHFKNLENLEIDGKLDLKLLETVIMNNAKTLNRLKITKLEGPWLFKFPCQMKELTCWFSEDSHSPSYIENLQNQRHLRYLFFNFNQLTNSIFDQLYENKLLTTMEFSYCTLEESVDVQKFKFLKNISEVSFIDVMLQDLTFVNAVLNHSEKVNRLHFEVDMLDEDPDEMLDLEVTVLKNLQIMQINGIDISKFISKRIKAPSLEVCSIDCYPEFLFDCKNLRTLNVFGVEFDCAQIINILKALQSLETFYFILKKEDLENTLKYIFNNLNNIKHFRLDLFGQTDGVDSVESCLKDFELNLYKTWNLLLY